MSMKKKLERLEELAINSGFTVQRDERSMFIERCGFGYHFETNVKADKLAEMISDAESFIRDILRLKDDS